MLTKLCLTLALVAGAPPAKQDDPPAPRIGTLEAKLARGVLAVRGHMKHVTRKLARIIAEESIRVVKLPGNGWLPAVQLIGIAINESDLRWWLRLVDRRGADCGIGQNRVSVWTRGGIRAWRVACAKVAQYRKPRRSIFESLKLTLWELNRIRVKWCCLKSDTSKTCRGSRWTKATQLRCVLNVYNQGPKFSWSWRTRDCKPLRGDWEPISFVRSRRKRCLIRNAYWLRSVCFARGVELGRRARWTCRYASSKSWIARAYRVRRSQRLSQKRLTR